MTELVQERITAAYQKYERRLLDQSLSKAEIEVSKMCWLSGLLAAADIFTLDSKEAGQVICAVGELLDVDREMTA